jgi:type IV pilus assembly protein PilA
VIGIIAILAAIVVVAINPARQFAQANNSQRWSNVNAILNAVHQYGVDNRGAFPAGLASTTVATEVCKSGVTCPVTMVDLSVLVPTYIVSIPTDPAGGVDDLTNGSGYRINMTSTSSGRVLVTAPQAELPPTVIQVER